MTVNQAYEGLLADVPENRAEKDDHAGMGTLSVFGRQIRYRPAEGLPCITTEFVAIKTVKGELLWLLSSDTNVRWLQERGIMIWDERADDTGELGPAYDHQ